MSDQQGPSPQRTTSDGVASDAVPEGERAAPEPTVGTGSALALGCVVITLVLILLGVLFFLALWLFA